MEHMRHLTLALLFCAVTAQAAAPQKAFPYPYDQYDFPNGLRLITVPTDFPNVVALYIVVQTGSRNEVEPGKTGFAHLFEHIMFRGTKAYPPEKWDAVMKKAGASSNAGTGNDLTMYHATFSKEDFETILAMEADRFQNLEYPEAAFRTEALAVLGEYNKNSASPTQKLNEVLRDTAYDKHTYKHTTMGFLKDIQDMPNQYEHSRQFFDRYYRPEYTTIVVVGDVSQDRVRAQVEKYWGAWKRGNYRPDIPVELPATAPRTNAVSWPTLTLPWVTVAFRGPAYSDTENDRAVLDIISYLGFSESSDLYQRLVIEGQKVDQLSASSPDCVDPCLFTVYARVKKVEDMDPVRTDILAAFNRFRQTPVPARRLESVKNHLRYRFLLSMDNSENIAITLSNYVALKRTPETINRLYDLYAQVTPQDIQRVADKYFVDNGRTIVTLTGGGAK
jgi:zinc protease